MPPVALARARGAQRAAVAFEHLGEVVCNGLADVARQRGLEQPPREAGWARSHRPLRSAGSRPFHIRSIARRAPRRLVSPARVTFTHKRALPPRSGVGSLIHDSTSPLRSSRRKV